jgi:hypothetical protein
MVRAARAIRAIRAVRASGEPIPNTIRVIRQALGVDRLDAAVGRTVLDRGKGSRHGFTIRGSRSLRAAIR